MGTDGVNPIDFLVLVGESDRQWLEPHYLNPSTTPLGRIRVIVPAHPSDPISLLDACIAFCPRHFRSCPSLRDIESALADVNRLDFHLRPQAVPSAWVQLRQEAAAPIREAKYSGRPISSRLNGERKTSRCID